MNELELKVTVDEANLILEALGQMPFKQVYALVGKIQEQANRQLSGAASVPAPTDPASEPADEPDA